MDATADPPSDGARRGRRPAGRRPGTSVTRTQILTAAREAFARSGYAATTLREVAKAADVDPVLLIHYYGSKEGLFAAALALPPDLAGRWQDAVSGPLDGLGLRLATLYLQVWEDPSTAPQLRAMVASAASHEHAAATLRDTVYAQMIGLLAGQLAGEDAQERAGLVASHLVGMAMTRHVLRVAPLADLPAATLAQWVAPTLQRYLTEPLPRG